MSELEIVEFIAMIIAIISIINIPFIIKRRKDFIKYLPGLVFLIIVFIASNLDKIFFYELFETIESISILTGATLLLTASLMELKEIFRRKKLSQINKFIQEENTISKEYD